VSSRLLARYERDRFVRPSAVVPEALAEVDRPMCSLRQQRYTALELTPLFPRSCCSALAPVDQQNVVTTMRSSEVASGTTSVLALACASRRRLLLSREPRSRQQVCLCATQRVVRAQAYQADPADAE
jgi:hypothetical protein